MLSLLRHMPQVDGATVYIYIYILTQLILQILLLMIKLINKKYQIFQEIYKILINLYKNYNINKYNLIQAKKQILKKDILYD